MFGRNPVHIPKPRESFPYCQTWHYVLGELRRRRLASTEKLAVSDDSNFQQDNDTKHILLYYLAPNEFRTPSQNPDLSKLEHSWDVHKQRIINHVITSKEMLKSVKITIEETSKTLDSLPNRL
ncbi:hypothetical protein TNCV_1088601 [Trichonephila clavipes]|uniref:Uncharacterized protein n=1 Tax=Trichonephila clavipes TaxID=2585209 RepID=A0A8X6SNP7_TRICX|nr:hypothetical protein TNCV_1088601 [Trichonephila clavipes]